MSREMVRSSRTPSLSEILLLLCSSRTRDNANGTARLSLEIIRRSNESDGQSLIDSPSGGKVTDIGPGEFLG